MTSEENPSARDHGAPQLLEPRNRRTASALRVVGGLGDGGYGADAVRPQRVAHVDAQLEVVDGGAEDVVAGGGDVGTCGRRREHDYAVALSQRRGAERGAAARGAQDDLDAFHVCQLGVGNDGVLRGALGVLNDQLQRPTVYATGRVYLLHREQLGLMQGVAVGLADPGERVHGANHVGLVRVPAAAAQRNQQQAQHYKRFPEYRSHNRPFSPRLPNIIALPLWRCHRLL